MANVAIVGSGIAGLVAAHDLHADHDITVYEAADWIGGHTHTVDVTIDGVTQAVDTGFIVHNRRTYPILCELFDELGVATQDSDMTFAVEDACDGLAWAGTNLNGIFAQRRRLTDRGHWRMLRDIVRFGRRARRDLDAMAPTLTLREYVAAGGFSHEFADRYLAPFGAAIWSADPAGVLDMPALLYCRFLDNHGLLTFVNRPRWRTVAGGAARYVDAITRPFADRIRLGTPVVSIVRRADGVTVVSEQAGTSNSEEHDAVVLACHSDQALAILEEPSPAEREIVGAIRYQPNDVVLHTDESILPDLPRAQAAWNHHVPAEPAGAVSVTYDLTRLQRLSLPRRMLVTLNRTQDIDPDQVLGRWTYDHPIFDRHTLDVQARWDEISGVNRTWWAGAWWRHGFHEDGAWSGRRAAARLAGDLQALPEPALAGTA